MHPVLKPQDHVREPEVESLIQPDRERRFGPGAILLVILVVGLGLAGWKFLVHGNDGWMHDLDSGLASAQESGRPILVFYTADWCPPCTQLKKTVLADPEVEAGLAEKFVRVKIDLTARGGPNNRIAAEQGVSSIPTMILYDDDGNEQERVTGGDLADWLYAKAAG